MTKYIFKTLYFPAARTRSGSPAKVTISLPQESSKPSISPAFIDYLRSLSGSSILEAIGNPILEDLEKLSVHEGGSLSNTCLHKLLDDFRKRTLSAHGGEEEIQRLLPFPDNDSVKQPGSANAERNGFGVTFRESSRLAVHSWYPYVEGFSAHYVQDAFFRFGDMPKSVYDPFGGAGTTQLAASLMGIPSFYAEVNPFMVFVAETKVKAATWARKNLKTVRRIFTRYLEKLNQTTLNRLGAQQNLAPYEEAFPGRDFFKEKDLRHLLAARELATDVAKREQFARHLLLLACAANVVRSSNMTRRADLRRRRSDEYKGRVVNVAEFIRESVERMLDDVERLPKTMGHMTRIGEDSRQLGDSYDTTFDIAITSPPYLNGTNYIRNTKLEMWFLGFLGSEAQLADFRRRTVCAGINDVSRARQQHTKFDRVEEVAAQLDHRTKDRRIPVMVRHYFSDMHQVLASTFRALIPGGRFFLDIGDSVFYGVHVPTDELLVKVAETAGFELEYKHLLARRYSRGDVKLKQFEIVLRKPVINLMATSNKSARATLESQIQEFTKAIPYKSEPYSSRNWGHPLHSLCSYQGKLKPGLAHWLVRSFVPPSGSVLDPLGGVGTIPFEAALAGHRTVSNDKSPFASIIAFAKINPPNVTEALEALEEFGRQLAKTKLTDDDYQESRFGLNSSVADYYHLDTLDEVLKARRLFRNNGWGDRAQIFLWASLLHILHGNRPYALSRKSHPVTPFAPSGPTEYRSLMGRLRDRIKRALEEPLPQGFRRGLGLQGDFRDLPKRCNEQFDAVITSPPFMGMRFDRPNWLRMWFCGWGQRNFHEDSQSFLEREQSRSLDCYGEFFNICRRLLKSEGILIVHIGSGSKDRKMVPGLKEMASAHFVLVADEIEDVQTLEKHGLKDKGRTEAHHLLFLQPRH
jgi:DNA modification methylase